MDNIGHHLEYISVDNYTTLTGRVLENFELSYQIFGNRQNLYHNGIFICHALTGNSNVCGQDGWWNALVGYNKRIDLNEYTVICFNIPGNGYDGKRENLIINNEDFSVRDVAHLFGMALEKLRVGKLHSIIGVSLGGGIAWEMAYLFPDLSKYLIPIATDYKASDWIIGHNKVQQQILSNSNNPLHDARMMAMLFYRSPESFKQKFDRSIDNEQKQFRVESYLTYHGEKLQKRFLKESYQTMTHLLSSINLEQDRGEISQISSRIKSKVVVIGIDTDWFFSAFENKELIGKLSESGVNISYKEIKSVHGHDAFFIENKQLSRLLKTVFTPKKNKMKVLKFGGKSLSNQGIDNVLNIVVASAQQTKLMLVLSARGNSTDELEMLLEKAVKGEDFEQDFRKICNYQTQVCQDIDLSEDFGYMKKILEGVKLLGEYSPKVKDGFLAFGEILSCKTIVHLLTKRGFKCKFSDTRGLLKTDSDFGNAQIFNEVSEENIKRYFSSWEGDVIQVVTGFIASDMDGQTTTLGRNGTNYSAALMANYLNAEELQNWTHVSGVYTADPNLVKGAIKIKNLSFKEANELANFGANILHAKTIIPLIEKNIPIRILNSYDTSDEGTLIDNEGTGEGIKALSTITKVALISLEGRGLLGKIGIDARIFNVLSNEGISVRIVSQASSERGIGFIVNIEDADKSKDVLEEEFKQEISNMDISYIKSNKNVAIISAIGNHLNFLHKSYGALVRNEIRPYLITNTINGEHVSLVVDKNDLIKSLNVIHSQIFGVNKKLNLAIFGKGNVGGTLIDQIVSNKQKVLKHRSLDLNIFAIASSKKLLLNTNGIGSRWREELKGSNIDGYSAQDVYDYAYENHLENLILVDTTAGKGLVNDYSFFIERGFDIVSANKIANTISYDFYTQIRQLLALKGKRFLYETNVGAGLPIVDTIKQLHHSGDRIQRIVGVFSGSLSYIFNTFSVTDEPFSQVLKVAVDGGLTEPDPREDLSGNDVARKLLVLARELDLKLEFEDIEIESLIPQGLESLSLEQFYHKSETLDAHYKIKKKNMEQGHVLRYVGKLDIVGNVVVKLVSVSTASSLGQIKGSDSIFEIYTEGYGDNPLIIQGAGAGAEVTARGVYGDILKLG